ALISLRSLIYPLFSFTAPATSYIYPLSLHDALPIYLCCCCGIVDSNLVGHRSYSYSSHIAVASGSVPDGRSNVKSGNSKFLRRRSEEHTSELQSRFDLVCRLLLEKKKKKNR